MLTFYGIEAWTRKTPWVFTDELEWTQISRAIEETGHAARRGEPIFFKSLYAYLIAPFWAIHSTETAYARDQVRERRRHVARGRADLPARADARFRSATSLVVALLSVCIPGMAYVTTIVIPEVLGLPLVRALLVADRARARDGAAARLSCWVGLAVVGRAARAQPQFATVPCRRS